MAIPTNAFNVSQLVWNDLLIDYCNSLGTASLAMNFDKFDYNSNVGTTMQINYPLQYLAVDSLEYTDADINATTDRERPITLDILATVPFALTAQDMTFSSGAEGEKGFAKKYLSPVVTQLGTKINQGVINDMELYCPDAIGDPSQPLNGIDSLTAVNSQLANMGLTCMGMQPYLMLSPNAISQLKIPYAQYYNEKVNYPILRDSSIQKAQLNGLEIYSEVQTIIHTTGTFAAAGNVTVATTVPLTESINQDFTSLDLSGFTASAVGVLNVGDLITFDNAGGTSPVQAINPKTYNAYPVTKKFVVIGNATGGTQIDADGSGDVTIRVRAPIVADTDPTEEGPYRNVSRQVVAGDVVTLVGGANAQYTKNYCFVRQAMMLANPMIASYPLPSSAGSRAISAFPYEETKSMTVPDTQLSIAFNMAAQGSLQGFNNQLAGRTIAGAATFNGYAFMLLSSV